MLSVGCFLNAKFFGRFRKYGINILFLNFILGATILFEELLGYLRNTNRIMAAALPDRASNDET